MSKKLGVVLLLVGLVGCSRSPKPATVELTNGVTEVQAVGVQLQRREDVARLIGTWQSTEFFPTGTSQGAGSSIFGIGGSSFTETMGIYRISGSDGVAIVQTSLQQKNDCPWTFFANPAVGEIPFLDSWTYPPRSAAETRQDEEASRLFVMASTGEVSFPDVLPAGPIKRIDVLVFPVRLDARQRDPNAPRLYRVTGTEETRVLAIKHLPDALKSAEFIHQVPDLFYPTPRALNLYTTPEGK